MDDGGRDAIAPFVRRSGINYVVLLGDDHVSFLYGGVDVLPTTYYISRNGDVIAFVNGVISKSEIERDIKQVLAPDVKNEAPLIPRGASWFESPGLDAAAISNSRISASH